MYKIRLIRSFHTIVIYIFFVFEDQRCYIQKNSKKTEESIKVDRKNDGTQEDISVDSVW